VLGFFVADYDTEPHTHGVAEPAQCLNVGYAATKFDARQCGLADARSLCDFLLSKLPKSTYLR